MARRKPARPARSWFIAAMGMVALGTLGGYAVGGFLAPAPVACEPMPNAAGAFHTAHGTVIFSMEKCEDGTIRMTPEGVKRNEPDMEPDNDGPSA